MNETKPMRLVLAAIAGILAAGFAAWFWMQSNVVASRMFGLNAVTVGLIVGLAIRGVAGRPDIRLAVLAGMLTLCAQYGGYYWIRWNQIDALAKANGLGNVQRISIPLSSVPPLLWPLIFAGVFVACSLALKSGRRTLPGK